MTEEIWKDIPDCPDYQASNIGNIRTCKINGRWGRKGDWRPIKLKRLSGKMGYLCFGTNAKGRKFNKTVHRAVLETFSAGPPDVRCDVAHLNGNPVDNRLENLQWASRAENMRHAKEQGTAKGGTLRPVDVRRIRSMLAADNLTQQAIADAFGISQCMVHFIKVGKRWAQDLTPE